MLSVVSGIILGIVQGLTEFLPISSSGHLILVRDVLGVSTDYGLQFDSVLHLATSLAVLIYFGKDILNFCTKGMCRFRGDNMSERADVLFWAVVLATIPASVIGYFFADQIESLLHNNLTVAISLAGGALFLWIGERLPVREKPLSIMRGLGVGFFQMLAFIPGFSRSGATIAGGLLLGLKREVAVRFAFLISFPILVGVGASQLLSLGNNGGFEVIGAPLFAGSVSAFIVGLASIHFMIRYLRSHSLNLFVVYRLTLSAIIFTTLLY
jgi:undecaprenyl-diphosphatase